MGLFADLNTRIASLHALLPVDVQVEDLPKTVANLSDEHVYELAASTATAIRMLEQVAVVTAGVIAARSRREAGHAGLAQSRGHRTPLALLQQVAGVTRGEAMRQARVGEALLDVGGVAADGRSVKSAEGTDTGAVEGAISSTLSSPAQAPRHEPWHAPLGAALRGGSITVAQHDAIRQGLGGPPMQQPMSVSATAVPLQDLSDPLRGGTELGGTELGGTEFNGTNAATLTAWALAADELLKEANSLTVEELSKQARAVRDLLDPVGAKTRFLRRYEARSFRMWTDATGLTHGKFVFDDESAAWLRSIIDTALRPRRGGPRFVSAEVRARARSLREDPRTNEQLTHDLLVDVWKAGAIADAQTVFGTRQAGVRMVTIENPQAGRAPVTRFEDSVAFLPATTVEKQRCNSGTIQVSVDTEGNPLNVGREQRLFTPKQRIALAIRDGGCRWPACDRPASYCEAHHIDEWAKDQGRTDIDRGLLLCSFHHMQLHNNGWKIAREGTGPFLLHPPAGVAAESNKSVAETLRKRLPAGEGTSVPSYGKGAIEARRPSANRRPEGNRTPEGRDAGISRETRVSRETRINGETRVIRETAASKEAGVNEGCPIEMRAPIALRYAWQILTPPPRRFEAATSHHDNSVTKHGSEKTLRCTSQEARSTTQTKRGTRQKVHGSEGVIRGTAA